MNIEIDGKGYELNFGFGFLRALNDKYKVRKNGQDIGAGLAMTTGYLIDSDPLVLPDIVEAGLHHVKKDKPGKEKIEEALMAIIEEKGVEEVSEGFLNTFRESALTSKKVKQAEEQIEKQQKKAKEQAENQ
ncbi:tail assembly chaperone [Salicibibacter kimchii]|uniref:tail assembly chaperone n=1 Tax=Salicibibacter kimchii TaxID=2099786 RepID=UPI001356D6E0|nr:tail assembly chaperone [Salicibibacter kimchii]